MGSLRLHPTVETAPSKQNLGLSFSLMGLFVMTVPSLNGTGVGLFGWDRWPGKVSFSIVAVGVLLALIGLALTVTSLRSRR